MPSFIKDELKKKDEQRLEEMQQEIDAAGLGSQPDDEPVEGEAAEAAGSEATDEPDGEAALAKQVADLEQAIQEKDDRIKRLQADFENFRRRNAKEREELAAVVTQNILKDLLPLLDNFDRALATENADKDSLQKGMEMMGTQLREIMEKNGLEPIVTKDAMFDPNFHQAVMRVQNPELMDDTIAAELQTGYMVKGHVIRPSMVQVVAN